MIKNLLFLNFSHAFSHLTLVEPSQHHVTDAILRQTTPVNDPYLNSPAFRTDFTTSLPGEGEPKAYPHQVYKSVWSETQPTPARAPKLISHIKEMTEALNIDASDPGTAEIFTGSRLAENCLPYSMRYGGHQFGNWAGQLGDGRAISLGEVIDKEDQHWTLQLKGAGPTPYSREGDGFAVLRSSIREYMCAEAIHHLGIPTTRSLTLCTTGETIARDVFYDGNVTMEQGAIVCRAAQSFVRFGNFEIHAACREPELLKELADYVIARNFPHLGTPGPDVYQQWFREILQTTASTVAHWQRVGFVHAVMNTDNMSILGQTIDYGPYGWLEEYDTRWTPNYIDNSMRRYSYGNQPEIALWNLYSLANALVPLFEATEPLVEVLDEYRDYYDTLWNNIMADKLGLNEYTPEDKTLIDSLWKTLQLTDTDFTIFFRLLSEIDSPLDPASVRSAFAPAFYKADEFTGNVEEEFTQWLNTWQARTGKQNTKQQQAKMKAANPKYVLRNYLALEAIDAAEQGDFTEMENMMQVLRTPYDDQPDNEKYAARRPDWATTKPGCTMLTCSS